LVEHILGKDEVVGSIPISGSSSIGSMTEDNGPLINENAPLDSTPVEVDPQHVLDMEVIADVLANAEPYGLEVEVIATALSYAKTHPEATIADCMSYGLHEWVK
jgi:hypothetical protein